MHWGRAFGVVVLLSGTVLASASCGKSVNEARALSISMDDYKTATIDFDPKCVENGDKAAPGFIAYLETKLKSLGAFEPAPPEAAQMVIRVRPGTAAGMDEDLHLVVDLIDAKNRATVGQIEITTNAMGGNSDAALRRAGDEIANYIRAHRRVPLKVTKGNTDFTPSTFSSGAAAPATPGVVTKDKCTTTCKSDLSSAIPPDDLQRIAERVAPTLGQARICLDRVSAQNINPSIIVRFEAAGQLLSLKLDAGGYDELACILDAKSSVPSLTTSRQGSLRCDHSCQR